MLLYSIFTSQMLYTFNGLNHIDVLHILCTCILYLVIDTDIESTIVCLRGPFMFMNMDILILSTYT